MSDEPEVAGLLALMLLHDARRKAREDPSGGLVPLERQDRTRWDRRSAAEGLQTLERALRCAKPGRFQIEAAIAAQHLIADSVEDTDWHQITALYAELLRIRPGPVYQLNHAVAVGMSRGPAAGLALLDRLEQSGQLAGYHLLPASQADLHRRTGNVAGALAAYRAALRLATNEVERRYLQDRIDELSGGLGSGPRRTVGARAEPAGCAPPAHAKGQVR